MKTTVQFLMAVLILGTAVRLEAQLPNFTPPTPLIAAAVHNDTAEVKRILATGANANEGQLAGFPPVFFAVFHHNSAMLRAMVEGGADLKATDPSGATVLMWAAYDELGRTGMLDELLKLGLDPNARNKSGETAMTWALRRGDTPIVARLRKAQAVENTMKEPIEKALALLQRSGKDFAANSGCVSCHHQSLPQMAVGSARERGFAVDEQISKQQIAAVAGMYGAAKEIMLTEPEHLPDPAISVSYALVGLGAEGYPADAMTDAMVHLISRHQLEDGRFRAFPLRPPIESSEFTSTALSIKALQLYGKGMDAQIVRGREWLETAKPITHEDFAMQLLGLGWAKADSKLTRKAADALIARQQPDGGWSQLAGLGSDAYATGQALVALHSSGQVAASDPVYRKGIGYLLRTQLSDGSWLVRSRTFPFQKYRESGFPHGKDQWISAAGTSWAVMALTLAEPKTKTAAQQ